MHIPPPPPIHTTHELNTVMFQNTGIGIAMSFATFSGQLAALAAAIPVLYGIVEVIWCLSFCFLMWKLNYTFCPPDTPVWKMLVGNWQPHATSPSPGETVAARPVSAGSSNAMDASKATDGAHEGDENHGGRVGEADAVVSTSSISSVSGKGLESEAVSIEAS